MASFSLAVALSVLVVLGVAHALPSSAFSSGKWMDESSAEIIADYETFMLALRDKCRHQTGSDKAFLAVGESIQTAAECIAGSTALSNFTADLHKLSDATRSTFFNRYCPSLEADVWKCFKGLPTVARLCFNDEEMQGVRHLAHILPGLIDVVCFTEGELLFKLLKPNNAQCFGDLGRIMKQCIRPVHIDHTWAFPNLTDNQCSLLSGIRQCVQFKLQLCNAPDLIRLYDLHHNQLFPTNTCRAEGVVSPMQRNWEE